MRKRIRIRPQERDCFPARNEQTNNTLQANDLNIDDLNIEIKTDPFEKFLKNIYESMRDNKVVPTPSNFTLYFEKNLEKEDRLFRENIQKITSLQESIHKENIVDMELKYKEGYNQLKEALKTIALIYKYTSAIRKISEKYIEHIKQESRAERKIGSIDSLLNQQEQYLRLLEKLHPPVKTSYERICNVYKELEDTCSIDTTLGIYNKKYLISRIEQETQLIKETEHGSIFVMMQPDKKKNSYSVEEKKAFLLFIARILQKNLKKSDCVAYYEKDMFGLLLPHQSPEEAKTLIRKILITIENSHFYIKDEVQTVHLIAGATEIRANDSSTEVLYFALQALDQAIKEKDKFAILSRKAKKISFEEAESICDII
jgi:diguanylate cyclase (GGDEF)-like protein